MYLWVGMLGEGRQRVGEDEGRGVSVGGGEGQKERKTEARRYIGSAYSRAIARSGTSIH